MAWPEHYNKRKRLINKYTDSKLSALHNEVNDNSEIQRS